MQSAASGSQKNRLYMRDSQGPANRCNTFGETLIYRFQDRGSFEDFRRQYLLETPEGIQLVVAKIETSEPELSDLGYPLTFHPLSFPEASRVAVRPRPLRGAAAAR